MATLNLRRFSNPETLKTIDRSTILDFLKPHRKFFSDKSCPLPPKFSSDEIDYEAMASILIAPDSTMPTELMNALFFIHEMATVEGMDMLLKELEEQNLQLQNSHDKQSPSDIAVQVWMDHQDILERKHAEQFMEHPRSFEYYQSDVDPLPPFKNPSEATLKAFQDEMDDWFEKKKRGRGSRVFLYPRDGDVWFLIRHGDPFRREGRMDGDEPSVLFRPEKFDVLVYDGALGEIRVNANSKGEKELYRTKFGKHLFGDEEFFQNEGKYTLEPLRTDGADSLECIDVEGLDSVKLREIQYLRGGAHNDIEIRKSDDMFASLKDRNQSIPPKAPILGVSFHVKFTDSKKQRTVRLRPPRNAQYGRDSDSLIIEDWLTKRGFIKNRKDS